MKLNALSVAAVAVAGLAVAAYARNRNQGPPPTIDNGWDPMATQHATVQAATPQNIDYLKNWQDLSNAWGSDPNAWL